MFTCDPLPPFLRCGLNILESDVLNETLKLIKTGLKCPHGVRAGQPVPGVFSDLRHSIKTRWVSATHRVHRTQTNRLTLTYPYCLHTHTHTASLYLRVLIEICHYVIPKNSFLSVIMAGQYTTSTDQSGIPVRYSPFKSFLATGVRKSWVGLQVYLIYRHS